MGCCFGILALIFPRVALVLIWLSGYGARIFDTLLWPLLGFIFMPYTTLAYVIAINQVGRIEGFGLALVIIGVILDLGGHGGSARYGRRRHVF